MAKFRNGERTCQAVKDYNSHEKPPRVLITKNDAPSQTSKSQHVIIQQ